MIIDGHCHVYPDKVAERALSAAPGERFGDGTVRSLIETMDAAGIDRGISLGVAATADNVASCNRFAGSLDRERVIGFGAVHVDLSVDENIEGLRANGLLGVKVHPYFQRFALDDPRLLEIFDAMRGEFVVIAHVGVAGEHDGSLCTPAMVRTITSQFPDLGFVACHLGGYHMLDEADDVLAGCTNVYIDTSWPPGLGVVDPGQIKRAIERHGPDRVIFASDWPMANPAADLDVVRDLGFSAETTEAILGGNLQALLRL